jgi:hypothetical protein
MYKYNTNEYLLEFAPNSHLPSNATNDDKIMDSLIHTVCFVRYGNWSAVELSNLVTKLRTSKIYSGPTAGALMINALTEYLEPPRPVIHANVPRSIMEGRYRRHVVILDVGKQFIVYLGVPPQDPKSGKIICAEEAEYSEEILVELFDRIKILAADMHYKNDNVGIKLASLVRKAANISSI